MMDGPQAEIERREDERRRALVAADATSLRELVDEGLVYRHGSLRMDDKASLLASMAPGSYRSIDVRHQRIVVRGDTAVVDLAETIVTGSGGRVRTHRVAALDVWARAEDRRWRLVARQASYEEPPS